jgi:hypothetical protein
MIDDSQKREILSEILESPEFKESKRFQELLVFLVEETLAGRVPKEITIGMQFFGKDASFDPKEDPIVRVYLNNLRKKIEHYYLTAEKPHTYHLSIPKGHYQVEFVEATSKEQLPAKKATSAYLVGILLLAAVFVAGFFSHLAIAPRTDPAGLTSPVWSEFVKPSGRPTLVVLGDFYFLFERHADGSMGNFVRDLRINTSDDYKRIIKQDPGFAKRYVQSDFTFLRPSASWGLGQILPIIEHSPSGYALKLASQFTVDDLKSNNIVFIGSFKTLYGLQKFLHIFGIEYTITPASFRVRGEQKDSAQAFSPAELKGGNYEKDFAVIAKGPGPDGSTILLLLGFADSGVIEASRAATDPKMLESIRNTFSPTAFTNPPYFTLVVETEGINQAIFKSEIRHFVQRSLLPHVVNSHQSDTSIHP